MMKEDKSELNRKHEGGLSDWCKEMKKASYTLGFGKPPSPSYVICHSPISALTINMQECELLLSQAPSVNGLGETV